MLNFIALAGHHVAMAEKNLFSVYQLYLFWSALARARISQDIWSMGIDFNYSKQSLPSTKR